MSPTAAAEPRNSRCLVLLEAANRQTEQRVSSAFLTMRTEETITTAAVRPAAIL